MPALIAERRRWQRAIGVSGGHRPPTRSKPRCFLGFRTEATRSGDPCAAVKHFSAWGRQWGTKSQVRPYCPVMTPSAVHYAFPSLTVVALGLLSACDLVTDKLTEKAVEAAVEKAIEGNSGNDVDIDTSGQAVTIKTKNKKGEEVVLQTQTDRLPESWPKDIPPYPGAKINGSLVTGKGGMLTLESSDTPDEVMAFYRSKVPQMKQKSEMKLDQSTMVTFEDDGGKRGLSVVATVEGGKTAIHLQTFDKGQ